MTDAENFLDELEHPLKPLVLEVRASIKAVDGRLSEHVKWNAPSFVFAGDDRITMKLFPPKAVQVVFHRGAGKKEQPTARLLAEDFGLLKWAANDRAVATFESLEEFEAKRGDFENLVRAWLEAVSGEVS